MSEFPPSPLASEVSQNQRDMSRKMETFREWGWQAIAETLDAPPRQTHDVAWGDGSSYLVGRDPEDATLLELYPAAGVARLTTHDAQITLFRQPPPSLYTDQLRFEQQGEDERRQLTLTRHGRLRLDIAPIEEDPAPPRQNAERGPVRTAPAPEIPVTTETPVAGHSRGHSDAAAATSHSPETPPPAERERVTLSGRLGRAPSFRTTRTGRLIASFPLAVRDEDGTTTWHTVLAFDERAEQLRDALSTGQTVDVVGYRHERLKRARHGEARTVEEIYATVVTGR